MEPLRLDELAKIRDPALVRSATGARGRVQAVFLKGFRVDGVLVRLCRLMQIALVSQVL